MTVAPQVVPWLGAEFPPRKWQAEALPIILGGLRNRKRGIVSAIMGAGKSRLQSELCHLGLRNLGDRCIVVTVPREALVKQMSATIAGRVGARNVGQFYGKKKQPERKIVVACNASMPNLALELAARKRKVALMICDEAHSTEGQVLRETIPVVNPVCLVGFTATPFRSVPGQTVSLFDDVFCRYTMEDAVRDGVLVEMAHHRVEGKPDEVAIDQVCLDMMREHAHGPGIVSARDINDAEEYAAWLTERDFPALAIHSKHSSAERDARIAALRTGEVRALVHVSLLAEGVDFPWLRWLCLRRNVQARVRFLQEIGRVLRTLNDQEDIARFGPKRVGTVLDPNLLLGRHGLTSVEAIGKALEEEADAEAREAAALRGLREPTEQEAVALDLLLEYLEAARAGLEEAGVVPPPKVEAGGWRLADISGKQVEAIKRASKLTRHIPEEHRDAIKALVKVPWALTRGHGADLLDVLYGGARWSRDHEDERPPWAHPMAPVQWSADLVVAPPVHDVVLAAGRGGRKMEPRSST